MRIQFGKHSGQLITRVPVGYLSWMVNTKTQQHEEARAELNRRGTVLPEIELSGHAIDRASFKLMRMWRQDEAGVHSWLLKNAKAAYDAFKNGDAPVDDNKVIWRGVEWVFEEGEEYPSLKTVMRAKDYDQYAPEVD